MKLIVFLDTLSRTILGEHDEDNSTDTHIAVKNPVILDIVPNQQTQQLQLRMIPVIFREFQAAKDDAVTWKFNRNAITENNGFELDFKITTQYQQMFSNLVLPQGGAGNIVTPAGAPAVPAATDTPTEPIRLFDD